jgi:hypothetical protein
VQPAVVEVDGASGRSDATWDRVATSSENLESRRVTKLANLADRRFDLVVDPRPVSAKAVDMPVTGVSPAKGLAVCGSRRVEQIVEIPPDLCCLVNRSISSGEDNMPLVKNNRFVGRAANHTRTHTGVRDFGRVPLCIRASRKDLLNTVSADNDEDRPRRRDAPPKAVAALHQGSERERHWTSIGWDAQG